MKLKTAIIFGLAVIGVGFVVAWQFGRRPRPLEITSDDLGFREVSEEELASDHLLDLNTATEEDLLRIGLDKAEVAQIADNRPYRNKLDLLSRMVIPEGTYNAIKHQIGVARATEPVKLPS